MKYAILILSHLITHTLFCQSDSAIKRQSHLNLEVGYSTSMFFENYTGNRFHKNTVLPSFYKIEYSRNRFSVFVDYKAYNETNATGYSPQNPKIADPGFIWRREYTILDLGFAYSFYLQKIKLFIEPSMLLCSRPYGTEVVFAEPNLYHPGTYYTIPYHYRSYGLGLGIHLRKFVYKDLYVGFETQYNYFFETKKGNVQNGLQEFDKNYKVNKNMISPIIKLGYHIHLNP